MKRALHFLLAVTLAAGAGIAAAKAQDYPNKPGRIIVPFLPGASNDNLGRITAEVFSQRLGQPFVVENKPGAASMIGADYVSKSPPDGYTLLFAASDSLTLLPAVKPNLPYQIPDGFTFIAGMFSTSFALVVSRNLPVTTAEEFIAYVKANPGKVRYGTSGVGGVPHVGTEMWSGRSGLKMVHVPYKGMSQVVTDILGGQIDMALITPPTTLPHANSDKIRVLATTGQKRSPLFPNLPTLIEAGQKDVAIEVIYGLVAPPGLPAAITDRLQKEVAWMLKDPDTVKKIQRIYFEPEFSTGQDFRKAVVEELKKWKGVAEAEKIVLTD